MDNQNTPTSSRRHFLRSATILGAMAGLSPRWFFGQASATRDLADRDDGPVQQFRRAAAREQIHVHPVRGGASLLTGQGGNIASLTSRDGVVLADCGIVGHKVAAALATIDRAPITHVVNTHWHFDHTDANAWLHARGSIIIAHENTCRRMSVSTRVDDWNFTFPASPSDAIPTTRVTTARTLQINGSAVTVAPYAPSHTDTDVSVHFTGPDVLCTGDTWWNGMYPFIDYSTGGSIGGTIRAASDTLARVGAGTLIVPGHGPVGRPADLMRSRDALVVIRDRVTTLKAQGRTVAEVVAAKPTAGFDAVYGRGPVGPDAFTRLVYKGV